MVRVQVHDINDAPIAVNDLDTLDEDTGILLNVLQNDADLADDIIAEHHAMHLVQMPNHGDLQIDGDQLIYTPKPNYYGNDYLRYAFCDQALCDTAMVRIHVRSINDEPIAKDDYLNTLSDLLLVFDPLINDHDSLDMEILDWSIISTEGLRQPSHGFTFVDLQVGLMIYVPDLGFVGADTFEYQVCDQGPDTILCDIALVYVSVYSPALSKPHLTPDLWETVRSGPQRHSSARIITEQQLQKVLKTHSAQEDLSPGNYRYIPDHPLGLVPQTY
ncbi:MAG: hypothetical protein IPL46_34420 [Saprospiraceae bacterium]|nr:hypothetical protein [Saprospiraceae bacterium]